MAPTITVGYERTRSKASDCWSVLEATKKVRGGGENAGVGPVEITVSKSWAEKCDRSECEQPKVKLTRMRGKA